MSDEKKATTTEGGKEEVKKVKKIKKVKPTKEGSEKKVKKIEDGLVTVKHSKAIADRDRNAYTGTRFKPKTSQQIAYDIVRNGAKNGTSVDKIKEELSNYKKENGKNKNLDAGYFPFVVASHPEDFEVFRKDGVMQIKLEQDVKPNESAIVELEAKAAKKKAAKEALKVKGKEKPSKKIKKKPTVEEGKGRDDADDDDDENDKDDDDDEKE